MKASESRALVDFLLLLLLLIAYNDTMMVLTAVELEVPPLSGLHHLLPSHDDMLENTLICNYVSFANGLPSSVLRGGTW